MCRRTLQGWQLACLLLAACSSSVGQRTGAATPSVTRTPVAAATASPSDRTALPLRTSVFGYSVHGAPLIARARGPESAARRILLVGCVHGNECAGIPVATRALATTPPAGTEIVVVPELNPDGHAAGVRQNAHGVDLNRNFPRLWKPIGARGDQQYAGTGPLSEPEARAMAALIWRLRPTVTVWFHQPVGVVDLSGGSDPIERRFAQIAGMTLRLLVRYPGSACSWQNFLWPGRTTAFVVELSRPATHAQLSGSLAAVLDLESSSPSWPPSRHTGTGAPPRA